MKKLPRGIIKVRTCQSCTDRIPVEVKRGKRTVTGCALYAECPDKKKYGPDYYIRYKVDGRDIKEKVGPSLLKARRALESRRGEIVQGKFKLEEIRPGKTLKEFAEEYLEYAREHKKSWKSDRQRLGHLVRHFGDIPLRKITQWHVKKYQSDRSKESYPDTGKSPSGATINREIACLRTMLGLAVKWRFADGNPAKGGKEGVKFFPEYRRERYLTEEELNSLLSVCSPRLKAIILTAFLTGQRKSVVLGLKWRNVDLKNCTIRIESKDAKNNEPNVIPFDPMLTEILEEVKINASEYVFPSPIKKESPVKDIRTALNNALTKAGLANSKNPKAGEENVVFHTFRHSFSSHHMMQGTDPDTLKELGGWKSNEYQRYLHLSQKHKARAARRLSNVLKSGKKVEIGSKEHVASK